MTQIPLFLGLCLLENLLCATCVAGIELASFTTACMVLCFPFVAKIVWITQIFWYLLSLLNFLYLNSQIFSPPSIFFQYPRRCVQWGWVGVHQDQTARVTWFLSNLQISYDWGRAIALFINRKKKKKKCSKQFLVC